MKKEILIDREKGLTRVAILEDEELEDPDCLLKIDAIIRLYFNELELRCDRHIEME